MGVASSSPTTSGGRSARPRRRPSVAICAGVPRSGFFFFSSRRRHTRSDRDRSSDVCSSDLVGNGEVACVLENVPHYSDLLPRHYRHKSPYELCPEYESRLRFAVPLCKAQSSFASTRSLQGDRKSVV